MLERIKGILAFNDQSPLIFTQADFWIFFALAYFLFALIYKQHKLRTAYLFLISLFFYYKTSGLFVGILLFSTVNEFYLGKWIYQARTNGLRKILLAWSLLINLGVLCYFKYAYFFTDSYNALFNTDHQVFNYLAQFTNAYFDTPYFTVDKIILPVGISFYTFQTLSYTIDIYRKQLKPVNSMLDFGLFVSFFPQLVAGPIVRASEFIPQINKPTRITEAAFSQGVFMILKGMIKKMVFADYIAMNFLDKVFDAPQMYTGFENVMALIGYSLQIYGDFSGYTDMAIGLALLMGFTLPPNFNSPYKAIHCGEFWRRWHISLSTWLRDYLYIPLGGNKKGTVVSYVLLFLILAIVLLAIGSWKAVFITAGLTCIVSILGFRIRSFGKWFNTNLNMMLTMLIGGLWHGANWKFVIWGGLNGVGILVSKLWRKISPYEHSRSRISTIWKIAITFLFITYTRIYFRSESMNHIQHWYDQVLHNMRWDLAITILTSYPLVFSVMLIGYMTHWAPQRWKDNSLNWFTAAPIWGKAVICILVGVLCYQAFSAEFQPFIYFDF